MNIFITGQNGFVGKYIMNSFSEFNFQLFNKDELPHDTTDYFLHFAGKAHDLKNTKNIEAYYNSNTDLTKSVFNKFLLSNAKAFITLSSVKAVCDNLDTNLTEDYPPNPVTHYGKSKLLAEQYILSKVLPEGKRVYILRPCMIHGPGNKGNLNLLYKIVTKGFPWPLGAFDNKRSFCSIDNLCFIINELISNEDIPSGVYNIADDEPLSTNELINLISKSQDRKPNILKLNTNFIKTLSKIGNFFKLPLNTERLDKLTETYIVSNKKIKQAINKPLPVSSIEGLLKTFNSFKNVH
jgi:nucleoside-diphosphate-sugar epimerase